MIVEVVGGAEERPEVRVVDVDDLSALYVALGEVTDEEATEALSAAGLGRLEDAGTAVLETSALRTAAGAHADDVEWNRRWAELGGSDATVRVPVRSAAGA